MSADIQPEPKHRNDLDGLRGVAVLPVLFYHAGIWPFFGGYVGVDVFFVLSGYLITGLILREYDAGRFSFAAFYDRRIRRILPALGAMLLVATLVAPFILLPDELSHYGTSLLGAVLSCANIFDWLRGAAYFAPLAGENPLLHVWSLSVEEQFYLLWPVLLVALARLRRLLPWAILALAALSLAMALAAAGTDPNAAFYLLPARAWQILLGALLAAGGAAPPSNVIARNGVAAAGAVLIAAAAVFSDATLLYHPWNALAAALGAAAILHASDGGPTLVGAALATRVPVFVGRISYSLYLWHWPALAFSRLFVGRSLSPLEASAVLVAVVPVAVLSWRYIEQPIRWRRWTWRAWPLSFAAAGGGAVLFVAAAGLFILGHGFPGRLPPDLRAFGDGAAASFRNRPCGAGGCVFGDRAFGGEAVLWGDSHAHALAPGLVRFAAARGLRLRELSLNGCVPLPGIERLRPDDLRIRPCTDFNRAALGTILRGGDVRLVILQAWWETAPRLVDADIRPGITRGVVAALDGLLRTLAARNIAVLLVGDVPAFPDSPLHCLGRQALLGRPAAPGCTVLPLAAAASESGAADAMLSAAARRFANTRAYFPRAVLCGRDGCHAVLRQRLLYSDTHHLSPFGADLVGAALGAALRGWP